MILRLHSKRLTERDYDTTSERFEIKSAAQSVGALSFLLSPYLLFYLTISSQTIYFVGFRFCLYMSFHYLRAKSSDMRRLLSALLGCFFALFALPCLQAPLCILLCDKQSLRSQTCTLIYTFSYIFIVLMDNIRRIHLHFNGNGSIVCLWIMTWHTAELGSGAFIILKFHCSRSVFLRI